MDKITWEEVVPKFLIKFDGDEHLMHGHYPDSDMNHVKHDVYDEAAYEQPTRDGSLLVIGFEEAAKVAKILSDSGYAVTLKTLEFVCTRFGKGDVASTETISTNNKSEAKALQVALNEVAEQIRDGYDMHMSYYGDKLGIHFDAGLKDKLPPKEKK